MSAPAANAFLDPVKIITLIESFLSASSKTMLSSSKSLLFRAFNASGRLSLTINTGSSCSIISVS